MSNRSLPKTDLSNQKRLEVELLAATPLLTSFLAESRSIHLAHLSHAGTVLSANNTLAESLKITTTEMIGQNFSNFLTSPDVKILAKHLLAKTIQTAKELLLNFVGSDHIPYTLRCRLLPLESGLLLLGEQPQDDNNGLQEELLQLNNQLTVLSRENVRKGRELAKALAELKNAQTMLVHQEKMASLGQMTAGIAHEINNPLAFVLGNEHVLQRDFDDLMAFINTLRAALPEIASLSPRIHGEIIARADEAGLEYLAEALPRKIAANIDGLERVKKIVLDLRNFSRLDEAEFKLCDLTEGIESTLRFLGPLLHEHGVTIETRLARLPQLLCSPGPLNQAISNIVANAIQASQPGQTVLVATSESREWFSIEVTDQGAGIPPENLTKVFDPFFTTKPVGSGTGLGLSITHQIVAAHKGKIEVESVPGAGTTFRVLLPAKLDS